MIRPKTQGFVFGLIMSYAMAIGMELYNTAYNLGFHIGEGGFGSMTNELFVPALIEAAYMGLIVLLFSNLWGNRFGGKFAAKHRDESRDNPYICRLLRQGGTVAVMCPSMSFAAAILFSIVLGGRPWTQLPAIWLGTVFKNFPMAFFWNFFAAAPFTHWLFGKLYPSAAAEHKSEERLASIN